MQQQTYSTRTAAAAVNVDPTTIQRAILRGELAAERAGTTKQARYRISREALAAYAAANELTITTGNGQVDPATGEVLETPAERAMAARARLEGVAPVEPEAPDPAEPYGPIVPPARVSNVATVVLPPAATVAADRLALLAQLVKAGHDEAARLVIAAWGL